MRILLVGSTGMVGRVLKKKLKKKLSIKIAQQKKIKSFRKKQNT